MTSAPTGSVRWRFWNVGGSLTAASGFLVLALFFLDAGRQAVPGLLGALFVVIGLTAATVGWKRLRAR